MVPGSISEHSYREMILDTIDVKFLEKAEKKEVG